MIQNKDEKLIKMLKGLLSGNNDVFDLLRSAETDRERIYCVFLISVGCQKVLGLEPKNIFDKLIKYKTIDDINSIIENEYEKKLNESKEALSTNLKAFIDSMSNEMIKVLNKKYDQQNRDFVTNNIDKFVLVKSTTENDKGIEYYTTEEGDGCFDMDIMYAKTFETFDEANQYRKINNIKETKIYSVEDCANLID